MTEMERRTLFGLETRAEQDKPEQIVGYFSKFNTLSEPILGWFREKMAPGAFQRSIKEGGDIKALFHHDPKLILGSTRAGTFRLREDGQGLYGEITPPDTTVAKDVLANMRAGNIKGASIGYFDRKGSVKWSQESGWDVRTVSDADLREGTVTGFPLGGGTALGVRSYLAGFEEDHVALICRAVNRIENKLDVVDEDRDILREYRPKLENLLPPEMRALIDQLVPAAPKVVPLSTWQAYIDIASISG